MPRNTPSVQLLRRSPRRLKAAISANVARPGLARSNTRSVAAQEGQEFLNALGFDPSVKRSVIAPRRYTVVLTAPRIRKSRIAPVAAPTPVTSSGKGKVRQQQSAKKQARAAKIASVKASVAAAGATQPKLPSAALAAPQFAPSRFGGVVAPLPSPQAQVPAVWKFKSTVPAFALHVSPAAVFFGDQSGRVVMFDHNGNTQQQVQLPAGVKSLVADTRWLYAGCDNGGVYDLTDPQNPRLAYVLPNNDAQQDNILQDAPEPDENAMDIDDVSTRLDDFALPSIRRKHVVFVVDTSGSMGGTLIQSAVSNVLSIIENQLLADDFISVIKFNSTVTPLFSGRTKAQHGDSITNAVRSLVFASGATALWSAMSKGFESLTNTTLPGDLEQWVVVLTDGANNVHNPGVDAASITNVASRSNTHIIAISVGNTTNADSLAQICNAATANGCASKHICVSASSQGVDEAFKVVAQHLNARVTSLSIADGLVSISDADGKITVCNIDGVKIWAHKDAAHRGGWMVRADARSVFQGHDGGVTRFNLRNGAVEASQALSGAVMSGCQTPDSLFIASGSNIFWFSKTNNTAHVVASVAPALILSNAAGMINNQVCLFTADSSGTISCFQWDASQPSTKQSAKWRLSCSEIGTPLAMQAFEDKLYVATMKGCLACIDISAEAIARGANAIQCIEKNIGAAIGEATVPLQKLPTTNDASQGTIVECKHELDDSEVLSVHKAIHDHSATHVTIRGRNYPVEEAQTKKLRFVTIGAIKFIEQNPSKSGKYGQMARSGHRITWCITGLSPRWGLVVDEKVESNVTPLKMRVISDGFDKTWDVQFPIIDNSQRFLGARFVVQNIFPAENGQYYRAAGTIAQLL